MDNLKRNSLMIGEVAGLSSGLLRSRFGRESIVSKCTVQVHYGD